ncbi:exodeoxyribonuclease I [Luminiphilus sp.]|nr:exodeoxyribonuclease I [Luminiphilus sp.]
MSSSESLYWHDYETSGADPTQDRPWQFAGIRTDPELNIVGEPLTLYAQPSEDRLPHPAAVRVTGITPQEAHEKGVPEATFISRILAELAKPNTCTVGYNSIRFDDEVTRFTLWRNLRDPYAREWQNGNSRWDLLDVVRAFWALSPNGLEWPQRDDGLTSFRLEDLTAANGIEHGAAHDALADVIATIEMAKRLKQTNTHLFTTLYGNRSKRAASALINMPRLKPLVYVSGIFGAARHNVALVVPVAWHPDNNSEVICVDLAGSTEYLDQPVAQLHQLLFTPTSEQSKGAVRPPLTAVRLNRAPVLLPADWLAGEVAERLGLDGGHHRAHLAALHAARAADEKAFAARFQDIWRERAFPPRTDPDQMLYDGFVNGADRALCQQILKQEPAALATQSWPFTDARLPELLLRYRARNFPDSLSTDERDQWREHCQWQRQEGDFNQNMFTRALAEERARAGITPATTRALDALEQWVRDLSVEG